MGLALGAGLIWTWTAAFAVTTSQDPRGLALNPDQLRDRIRHGRYADAELDARAALASAEARYGPESAEAAGILDVLVVALWRLGSAAREEAQSLARRAVSIRERSPADRAALAFSLTNLANVLWGAGDHASARPLYERALNLAQQAGGPDHLDVARVLVGLGWMVHLEPDNDAAREIYERALRIRESALGPDHPDVAEALTLLGAVLLDMGDAGAATAAQERALRIQEAALGPDHPSVAETLHQLGTIASRAAEYAKARSFHERALAMREKALGPNHPLVAWSLTGIANQLAATGDYAAAAPLYERAVKIWERSLGPGHADLGAGLLNLAVLRYTTGDLDAARRLYERALGIWENAFGSDHPLVAVCLNNLALVHGESGDLIQAKRIHERALAMRKKLLGPSHADVAVSLANLAQVSINLGDLSAAKDLLERALRIWEKVLGPDHPKVAQGLLMLGAVLKSGGDLPGARSQLERAVAILEKTLGPDNDQVAGALGELGRLEHESGRIEIARPLYERAVSLYERTLGPAHPDLALTLERLALLMEDQKDLQGARTFHQRALEMTERTLGASHPQLASSLAGLAGVLFDLGERDRAIEAALRAEGIGREHLRITARALSEKQALLYAPTRPSGLDMALSVLEAVPEPATATKVWDALIRSRALVLDEMAARRRLPGDPSDPATVPLLETVAGARRRLANLTVRGPAGVPPDRYRALLDQARDEKEAAERSLAERSLAFRKDTARGLAGFEEVARVLPDRTALVAFVRFVRHGSPRESASSYLAFVLPARARDAAAVPLGPARRIESLVSRWWSEAGRAPAVASGSAQGEEPGLRAAGEDLRRAVWDPIAPHLAGAQRVFVVSDAALNLVDLATLPVGESSFLIEQPPLVHYLSAERDLVRQEEFRARGRGLLALGDPAYDEAPISAIPGTGGDNDRGLPAAIPKGAPASLPSYRGATSACDSFESMRFAPLPASADETRRISSLFKRRGGPDRAILNLSGPDATEAAFKRSAPGRRVLHLATHGFFLAGACAPALGRSRGIGGILLEETGPASRDVGENPLLMSGLALAGANRRAGAAPDQEDGILTGEEIAALDLSGVEWAVLSACHTAVGEIRAGEGVLGLRRAFEIAGVRTTIMSLWPVDDEAARSWMEALYEARLTRGLETSAAVREASLRALEARRRKGLGTHPVTWKPFVASGDWR